MAKKSRWSSLKMGVKTFDTCLVFPRLQDLMSNIFWTKHDIDNWARSLESTWGLLYCLKIRWTLVHKRLKIGPEVSLTHHKFCVLLHYQVLHTANLTQPNNGIPYVNDADGTRKRWRRIANVNEKIDIRLLVSRGLKTFNITNGIASGGLQWQYIVNCHIF